MFATKIFSLPPALKLDFPKIADLEKLARQGLAQAHKTQQELTPVWRQASGKALDLASRATRQLTHLVETQVWPLVERKLAARIISAPVAAPSLAAPLAAPAQAQTVRKPGPLFTARLAFQLLCLAIAEKAREVTHTAPKP